VPEDFAELARPTLERQMQPGERLEGICTAVHQKTFSGQLFAIGVTNRRLVLQPVGRHGEAEGDPVLMTAASGSRVALEGAGDDWATVPMMVLNAAALTLTVQPDAGKELKLMMMKGGTGLLGGLAGGTSQQTGVLALADWIRTRSTLPGG
jgi:hypothetical protein